MVFETIDNRDSGEMFSFKQGHNSIEYQRKKFDIAIACKCSMVKPLIFSSN